MPVVAEILIPLALDTPYSYVASAGLDLAAGDVVQVPLGPREIVGVVWGVAEMPGGSNLRPVTGRLPYPPLSDPLRSLVDWIARYTLAPKGSALAMVLRLPSVWDNPRTKNTVLESIAAFDDIVAAGEVPAGFLPPSPPEVASS